MAQSVERVLGKDEVTSSNLVSSSKSLLGVLSERLFVCLKKFLANGRAPRGCAAFGRMKRKNGEPGRLSAPPCIF
jgi:hypothetical protein